MPNFVFSKQTCAVNWKSSIVRLEQGAVWDAGDPFVKDRPEFFADSPVVVHHTGSTRKARSERPVEDASAEPGKKRSTK